MIPSQAEALKRIADALLRGRGMSSQLFQDRLSIYDSKTSMPVANIHSLDDAGRVFEKLVPGERTDLYRRLRIARDAWYREHKTRLKNARESIDVLIDQATGPGVPDDKMHALLMSINDIEFEFSGDCTVAGEITEELGLGDGQLTEEEHDAVNELIHSAGWSRADAVSEVIANRDDNG
jgi:hypothetical protein